MYIYICIYIYMHAVELKTGQRVVLKIGPGFVSPFLYSCFGGMLKKTNSVNWRCQNSVLAKLKGCQK